jgi:hypothetical protein
VIGPPAGQRLGEAQYAELVARVRATVAASVPPGASVLVLSRGDATLTEIPGLAAAHFPQDASGDYAGHHPADSADATARLQALQRRGAEYLVIPATARWWLKFYVGFAEHLASHCELIADVPDACLIYGLGRRDAPEALGDAALQPPRASIEQMRDYLENLISTDRRVAVLETGEQLAAALAPMQAAALAGEDLEREGGELRGEREQPARNGQQPQRESERPLPGLTRLAERGVDYLVVPRSADEWLQQRPDVAARIEARCRKVADQRHLCRVFELRRSRAA